MTPLTCLPLRSVSPAAELATTRRMGEPERAYDEEGTELLLVESGERERSWRLNFDGFRPSEPREKPPPRGLHDCLGVLGSPSLSFFFYSLRNLTARVRCVFFFIRHMHASRSYYYGLSSVIPFDQKSSLPHHPIVSTGAFFILLAEMLGYIVSDAIFFC